jgi:hypothetical protein
MVDRRPRMRKSRRNTTVLLFTCLIQRSDGSCMNSLFMAVGCLGFFYKTANLSRMNSCPCAPPLLAAPCAPPSPSLSYCRRPKGRSQVRRKSIPFCFFPLCLCLDLGFDFSSNREVLVAAVLFCSLGSCSRSNIF